MVLCALPSFFLFSVYRLRRLFVATAALNHNLLLLLYFSLVCLFDFLLHFNSVFFLSLPPPATGPPLVPKAHRLHPSLLPLCQDLSSGPGGLTGPGGRGGRHRISFRNRTTPCFCTTSAARMQSTNSHRLSECSLYVEIDLFLWEGSPNLDWWNRHRTNKLGLIWDEPCRLRAAQTEVKTEEPQMKTWMEPEAEGSYLQTLEEEADRALLSRPPSEGLDTCSTVEINSRLIRSKHDGKLLSVHQSSNLFAVRSGRTFWISLSHFSSPNTRHCGKTLCIRLC